MDSPAKFKAHMDGSLPSKKSSSLSLGTALHCAILEPERFQIEYKVYGNRRSGKAWEELQWANPGITYLSISEHEKVMMMHQSINEHPTMVQHLQDAMTERSLQFSLWGRACKARFDAIGKTCLIDVKMTRSIAGFAYDARKYGYPMAAAFYYIALARIGVEIDKVGLFAVENNPPFEAKVFWIDEVGLLSEIRRIHHLFEVLGQCEATNVWPAGEVYEEGV
jgi:exodeoxyribonuclease VIII